jgi:hypothetical protein
MVREFSRETQTANRRARPAQETRKTGNMETPVISVKPTRRQWYKEREIPASCLSMTIKVPPTAGDNKLSRGGLYYNSVGWTDYLKETLQAIIREKQAFRETRRLKPVLAESGYVSLARGARVYNPLSSGNWENC